MARYLVKFKDTVDEEFDVTGFSIMSEKDYNKFQEIAESITWEFYFFASKSYLFYSSGEDFLSRIELQEITKDQFDAIEKVFGIEFGTFINEEFLKAELDGENNVDESDDSEDEDY